MAFGKARRGNEWWREIFTTKEKEEEVKVSSSKTSDSSSNSNVFSFNFFSRFSKKRTGNKTPFSVIKSPEGIPLGRKVVLIDNFGEEHTLLIPFPGKIPGNVCFFDGQPLGEVVLFSKKGWVEIKITHPDVFTSFMEVARQTGAWAPKKKRVHAHGVKISLEEFLKAAMEEVEKEEGVKK